MAPELSKNRYLCVTLLCVVAAVCAIKPFPRVREWVYTAAERAQGIIVTVLVLRIIQWAWYRAGRRKQLALTQLLLTRADRGKAIGHNAKKFGKSEFTSVQNRVAQQRPAGVQHFVIETVAVLGSGGHTEEMLHLLRGFNPSVYRIHFVLAESDKRSLHRLSASDIGKKCVEAKLSAQGSRSIESGFSGAFVEKREEAESAAAGPATMTYSITRIPRSREVGQSWFTSLFSFLRAFLSCLALIWSKKPRLVLLNGPGTCVPVAYAALLHELLTGEKVVLVYVESVCRVENLSLSGYILYPFVDKLFVQWPTLRRRYPQCEYYGLLY